MPRGIIKHSCMTMTLDVRAGFGAAARLNVSAGVRKFRTKVEEARLSSLPSTSHLHPCSCFAASRHNIALRVIGPHIYTYYIDIQLIMYVYVCICIVYIYIYIYIYMYIHTYVCAHMLNVCISHLITRWRVQVPVRERWHGREPEDHLRRHPATERERERDFVWRRNHCQHHGDNNRHRWWT